MWTDPLFILVVIAVLIVLGVLATGILTFGRGGETNRKNANKLMRYRIYAQAVAIVLILVFIFFRQGGA